MYIRCCHSWFLVKKEVINIENLTMVSSKRNSTPKKFNGLRGFKRQGQRVKSRSCIILYLSLTQRRVNSSGNRGFFMHILG